MKYLEKTFSIAVTDRRVKEKRVPVDRNKKHKYLNGGVMCLVCGLGKEAHK